MWVDLDLPKSTKKERLLMVGDGFFTTPQYYMGCI